MHANLARNGYAEFVPNTQVVRKLRLLLLLFLILSKLFGGKLGAHAASPLTIFIQKMVKVTELGI